MLKKCIIKNTFLITTLLLGSSGIINAAHGASKDDKTSSANAASQSSAAVKKISKEIQGLKKNVVALNKDLRLIEEALLFPSSTKYTVFLSLDAGRFFTLESVKVKIDGKLVTSHVYSTKQRSALSRGGEQKLHVTNLNEGKHSVTAFFTGLGPNGRPYKRASTLEFDKGRGSQFLELAVVDDESVQEPIFNVNQW